jgi:hypothetical protein
MDELAARYAGRVRFLFAYAEEAHPRPQFLPQGYKGDPSTFTAAPTPGGRRAAARVFREALKVRREVLVDPTPGRGDSSHPLPVDGAYNPVFVIGPDGRLLYRASWLDAQELDAFLQTHLASAARAG